MSNPKRTRAEIRDAIKKTKMSKEQTPMNELLSIVEELKSKGQKVDTNGLEDWINSVGLGKEKQYTKAKVLEALEKHIPKFMRWCDEGANIDVDNSDFEAFKEIAENYIETEVKPKYE